MSFVANKLPLSGSQHKKLADNAAKKTMPSKRNSPIHAKKEQILTIDFSVPHHNAVDLSIAESIAQQVFVIGTNQPVALSVFGVIVQQVREITLLLSNNYGNCHQA